MNNVERDLCCWLIEFIQSEWVGVTSPLAQRGTELIRRLQQAEPEEGHAYVPPGFAEAVKTRAAQPAIEHAAQDRQCPRCGKTID